MKVKIPIKQLVEFVMRQGDIDNRFTGTDRALLGSKIHRQLQKKAGADYKAEVSLSTEICEGEILYTIYGRADGVIEGKKITVDEIKTVSVDINNIDENFNDAHWAQAKCYGYIICLDKNLQDIDIRMSYFNIDSEEIKYITQNFTILQLKADVHSLLKKYEKWAMLEISWKEERNLSLKALTFPFDIYRTGQRKLAVCVYNTIKKSDRLFACAPTGIGKTMSTIFPSLKAMGENYGDKLFYLTAKTVTAMATAQAIEKLNDHYKDLKLKTLFITAKDKICPMEVRQCNPNACPYARGYFDKINEVLYWVLQCNNVFDRDTVLQIAKSQSLCPYELSLDLSLWCDVIVCDYNYLFDPVVKLQRYFSGKSGDYIFLIDEAHNLPDRAREMYSASIDKKEFLAIKKIIDKKEKRFLNSITKVNSAFLTLRHKFDNTQEDKIVISTVISEIEKPLTDFIKACGDFFDKHKGETTDETLLQLYFETKFFLKIFEEYDDKYVTILSKAEDNVFVRLNCVDPSDRIGQSLEKGRSSVLFSATLSPLPYYRQIMGDKGNCVNIESPFSKDNCFIAVADKISTKYADRQKSFTPIIQMLDVLISSKVGNYMAFFPSYKYMESTFDLFVEQYPQAKVIKQKLNMSGAEREEFIAAFDKNNKDGLLGFCVLGGIYGEGIDLVGERLIGCAVVGVGLSAINTQTDVLKDYYNDKNQDGFAFAYQYPGMNKVMQAAGRVIRTDSDKGVVLLIDSRFTLFKYRQIMPPHWSHIINTESPEKLSRQLKEFWNNSN